MKTTKFYDPYNTTCNSARVDTFAIEKEFLYSGFGPSEAKYLAYNLIPEYIPEIADASFVGARRGSVVNDYCATIKKLSNLYDERFQRYFTIGNSQAMSVRLAICDIKEYIEKTNNSRYMLDCDGIEEFFYEKLKRISFMYAWFCRKAKIASTCVLEESFIASAIELKKAMWEIREIIG